ncbi:MAG: hypothetical protein ACOC38_09360 [Promethearchaeia archaeon]
MKIGNMTTDEMWNTLRTHPFLFAFGIYIGSAIEQWLGFILGYVPLMNVVFFTVGTPLVLLGVYLIKNTAYRMTFENMVIIIGGSLALGWPIWMGFNYLLYVPIWAPFHGSTGPLNTAAFVTATILAYGCAAYIMFTLQSKRGTNHQSNLERPD